MVGEHSDRPSERCRDCGASIVQDPRVRARNGTLKPLGPDGLPHRCYRSKLDATESEHLWLEQAEAYVAGVNNHLTTVRLKLVREVRP